MKTSHFTAPDFTINFNNATTSMLFKFINLIFIFSALSAVISGCGSMPLPKAQQTAASTDANTNTLTANEADSTNSQTASSQPGPDETGNTKPPPIKLSAEDYVNNAIISLQTGNKANARRAIDSALDVEPNNARADLLLKQIVKSPQQYFPEQESFSYTTKNGDTFSILAEKYLHDPLKFYILAKYNNYDKPNALKPGAKIKIPGKDPHVSEPVVEQNNKPATTKPAPDKDQTEIEVAIGMSKKYNDSGKYQNAIDLLDDMLNKHQQDQKLRDALVVTYTRYAGVLAEKAELLEAQSVLEKAVSMQPGNSELKRQLTAVRNKREADRLYQVGMSQLSTGDEDSALRSFNKALNLAPDHKQARTKIVAIKSDVIEQQHKKAMTLYRKQQLKEAIDIWDDVLSIDPAHELAKLYRARAMELQKRIDKFE